MEIQRQFTNVHWIWGGATSTVYEVHPYIVLKVPKPGEEEKEQFRKELEIMRILSQHPPSPHIVRCFYYSDNGIFLEYMRGTALHYRLNHNCTIDDQTHIVTKVEKLEPLPLRKEWMNDLAQAVAFLESLNLAHGDLRPENILIHHDRLKLADFDCTAEFGTDYEVCVPPWGRLLNSSEADQGLPGSSGYLGPRTELFALGSLYYLINYGFEVYGDRLLTDDVDGPNIVNLLQDMVFPELNCDPLIDDIIDKCWHNKFASVAELAAHTQALLAEETETNQSTIEAKTIEEETNEDRSHEGATTPRWLTAMGRLADGLWCKLVNWWMSRGRTTDEQAVEAGAVTTATKQPTFDSNAPDEDHPADDHSWKKAFCQALEKRGLLDLLSADEPENLGLTPELYRYSSWC